MRVLIRVVAVVVGVAGVLASAAGVAGAVYVGRDDTVPLVTTRVASAGVAVVTEPRLLGVHGPTLHVTAADSGGAARGGAGGVFVGIAHTDDLTSYLGGQHRTVVTAYGWPRSASTAEVDGGNSVTAPTRLDWWVAQATGEDGADLAWPMTDGHFDLVVMAADGRTPVDLDVRVGLQLDGLFATALGVAGAGLAVVGLAVLAFVLTRRRPPQPAVTPTPVPA